MAGLPSIVSSQNVALTLTLTAFGP